MTREPQAEKTYRAGRVTRNPFLNFLREFRVTKKGMSIREIASKGAKVWRSMTDQQKASYKAMAKEAPIRKSRRRRTSRHRRRGRSRGRRRRRRSSSGSVEDRDDDESSDGSQSYSKGRNPSDPGPSNQ